MKCNSSERCMECSIIARGNRCMMFNMKSIEKDAR